MLSSRTYCIEVDQFNKSLWATVCLAECERLMIDFARWSEIAIECSGTL